MTLVAGSYERFLFGFALNEGDEGAPPERTFTHPAHQGAVKSLAACGPVVASGGSDDCIHIYDSGSGRDLGFVANKGRGAVSALAFFAPAGAYSPTHLLAGAADGSISVWVARGAWECAKSLTGHRGPVTALALHPSGRAALSTSRDGALRMWDLAKGRTTLSAKLPAPADAVAFSPSGQQYAVMAGDTVTLHSLLPGSADVPLRHASPVLCMTYLGDGLLLTGCEGGALTAWETASGADAFSIAAAHGKRIRGIAVLPAEEEASAAGEATAPPARLVATAGSDGAIKVWDVDAALAAARGAAEGHATETPAPICRHVVQTGARLTTLVATHAPAVMARLAKRAAKAARPEAKARADASPAPRAKAAPAKERAGRATPGKERVAKGAAPAASPAPAPRKGKEIKAPGVSKGKEIKAPGASKAIAKSPAAGKSAAKPKKLAPRAAPSGVVDFTSGEDLKPQKRKRAASSQVERQRQKRKLKQKARLVIGSA